METLCVDLFFVVAFQKYTNVTFVDIVNVLWLYNFRNNIAAENINLVLSKRNIANGNVSVVHETFSGPGSFIQG